MLHMCDTATICLQNIVFSISSVSFGLTL